ncbi:hypothetical protein KM043_000960 [Ampulex compressa]|nr:hypothetical protein KM043_000960 [Ampulex compressa]
MDGLAFDSSILGFGERAEWRRRASEEREKELPSPARTYPGDTSYPPCGLRKGDDAMRMEEGKPPKTGTFPVASATSASARTDETDEADEADELPIQDYLYRGEGNANIVLALPKEYKVLRFRKSLPAEAPPSDGGKARVEREVEFVRDVVSFFLGTYVQIPDIIRCGTDDVARICDAIRPFRPEKRRHKEISGVYATKLPDYTFIAARNEPPRFAGESTFCVEIKPKQGYLREGSWRYRKCPYCLTQYYKLKRKAIARRSDYCPFDLFSGARDRMRRSLESLLRSPQNNLKIFKDGRVVYEQESSPSDLDRTLSEWFRSDQTPTREARVERFCDLVCTALLSPFLREPPRAGRVGRVGLHERRCAALRRDARTRSRLRSDAPAEAEEMLRFATSKCDTEGVQRPPKDSVLGRILSMQRLPYVSTEYVYHIYSEYGGVISDDLVYSNLSRLYARNARRVSASGTPLGILAESVASAKDAYPELPAKGLPVAKRRSEDLDGNPLVNFASSWSVATNRRLDGVPLTSRSNRPNLNRKNLYNYASNEARNENDLIYDERDQSTATIGIEALLALQNYLLFSTARDCSILMAFQELSSGELANDPSKFIIHLPAGPRFLCNIGVSDLDPKSVQCIEKHRRRDTEVIDSVISILEEEIATRNPPAAKEVPPR